MTARLIDLIPQEIATTLDALFHERARRSPDRLAYRYYDDAGGAWRDLSWSQVLAGSMRWQAALLGENLQPGDRVAIMLKNCPDWVMFDQAALGLGLVVVPLYTSDRPENVAHVLADAGCKLLLVGSLEQWRTLSAACAALPELARVISLAGDEPGDDPRLRCGSDWLPAAGDELRHCVSDPQRLATIIYTSGTTGRPKGVMLSHHNLISNIRASLQAFDVYPDDILLSFMPLSHSLERTVGYYLAAMAGAAVAYTRSVLLLQEDLAVIRPTILIAVPRIFERIQAGIRSKLDRQPAYAQRLAALAVSTGYSCFEHAQGRGPWRPAHLLRPLLDRLVARKLRDRLGGRLRLVLCGGAALPPEVARTFIGLGLNLLQGYGLTETSPVISVNRSHDNLPASVGPPLPGIEVRLGDQDVLQVRGPNLMQGYWHNPEATRAMFTDDGWLITGDVARIDEAGRIFITGRVKEIIVLSNGEKVPPADIEAAILRDPLFEQAMLAGEGKPYLSLFAVVNRERWDEAAADHGMDEPWPAVLAQQRARSWALARVTRQIREFPGYARIRRITLLDIPWSIENGLLTPTLKVRRGQVLESQRDAYEKMYAGYNNSQ